MRCRRVKGEERRGDRKNIKYYSCVHGTYYTHSMLAEYFLR